MTKARALLIGAVVLASCRSGGDPSGASPASAGTAALSAAGTARSCYSVAEIGPVFDTWLEQTNLGINSRGVVAGTTPRWAEEGAADPRRAFVFNDGAVSPLGDLGGGISDARAVNASGVVVGGSCYDPVAGPWRATSFRKGVVTDLGALDGTNSWAMDVNDAGYAVGSADLDGVAHAAAFFEGRVIDLGTIGLGTYANGVNDAFEVAGTGQLEDGTWSAFLLRRGRMMPLGEAGVPVPSTGVQINNRGTLCGQWYAAEAYEGHGFLYHRDGTIEELESLGYEYTYCSDVSDTGVAVGVADDGMTGWRATAWVDAAEPIDLNTRLVPAMPNVQLVLAARINSVGQIVAYGIDLDTWVYGGYLLTPVNCPK